MTGNKESVRHSELIEGCRRGDRKAQTGLYRMYYRAMYNVSLRLLNNAADAEDVMQESFLAAFLRIGTYRGEVSFGSWLKRIVVNRSIDMLRSRKAGFTDADENLPDDGGDDAIFPEEEAGDAARTVERVRKALQGLPDGFRVVLTLFLFEGYDHEEIARILGISESTSRSQLARAKKKLILALKDMK